MSLVLVAQSYRSLEKDFNQFQSPYDLEATFWLESPLSQELKEELTHLENTKENHLYQRLDFKFFPKDNQDLLSDEVKEAIAQRKRRLLLTDASFIQHRLFSNSKRK